MIIKSKNITGAKNENKDTSEKTACEDVKTTEIRTDVKWYLRSSRQYQLFFGAAFILLLMKLIWMWYTFQCEESLTADDINKKDQYEYLTANIYGKQTTIADADLSPPIELKFVSRDEWSANHLLKGKTFLLPVPYVIISHTATNNCSDVKTCSIYVKSIQHYRQMTRMWADIGYNFLVGGDGYVYEGQGWEYEGDNNYGYNSTSIGIAFIGNFDETLPPVEQITAAKQLIQFGVDKGYIDENYKVLAARQLIHTISPGLELYKNIKTWPHWSRNL